MYGVPDCPELLKKDIVQTAVENVKWPYAFGNAALLDNGPFIITTLVLMTKPFQVHLFAIKWVDSYDLTFPYSIHN